MKIGDPITLCGQLGGLHDVEIERLALEGDALLLRVADLFGNFEGLPQYPGPLPGTLTFTNAESIEMVVESAECLTIFSLAIGKDGDDRWDVEFRFVPGGRLHLTCTSIEGDFDPEGVRRAAPRD